MNAVREQPAVVESTTAAARLETAKAGLKQLHLYQSAATARKNIAAGQLEKFSAELRSLCRRKDLEGADVDLAISAATEGRDAAVKAIAAAGVDIADATARIGVVNSELPRLESDAMQDELRDLVATGKEQALRYRAAVEELVTTGVEFQQTLKRVAVLEDAISRRGFAPRCSLKAHLIDGGSLDQLWRVARDVDAQPGTVDRSAQNLFSRWRM